MQKDAVLGLGFKVSGLYVRVKVLCVGVGSKGLG